jgi:hypothetical protein
VPSGDGGVHCIEQQERQMNETIQLLQLSQPPSTELATVARGPLNLDMLFPATNTNTLQQQQPAPAQC